MSAPMPAPFPAGMPALPAVTDAQPVPFGRLLKVEFRKSWDSRAAFWLLVTIAILVTVAELIATLVTGLQDEKAAWGDFAAVAGVVTSFLLPVLGIMLVTTEWGQRTAMVTFALEPRRPMVIAAKALVGVVLTLATVATAIVVGAVCNVIYALLAGHSDWDLGLGDLLGFIVTQILAMLGGFAFACLLLNTAAAIVTYFVYAYVVPGLIALGRNAMDWFDRFAPWIDLASAQEPFTNGWDFSGEDVAHLITSALLWLGVPLFFGLRRILRAEVK